ncbi:MAG TPA: ABC transporter ATP-binding protein, partial [Feifaniaceae bacterium]|nr:ABC transporter ATP-binding protein [Feifaniaceae bacterium]
MGEAPLKKQKRPKPPYPPLENIGFMLKKIALWDKAMYLWGALEVPALVLLPLLSVYMSKLVVETVTSSGSPLDFLLIVLAFSAAILLCNIVINTCGNMLYNKSTLIRFRYINLCSEKNMETDFGNVESPDGQSKMKRAVKLMDAMKAQTVIGGRVEGAQQVVGQMTRLFSGLFGIITYAAIISALSPWIIALIVVCTAAGYLVDKRFTDYLFSTRKIWRPLDERINYIKYTLDDPSRAKDVILYDIKKWMVDFFRATAKLRTEWHYRIFRRHVASNVMGELCALIRDALALGYLVYRMVERGMPISDFVLYFGVIGGFSGLLLDFAFQAQGIYETALEFCDYREFLDLPDKLNRAKGVPPVREACEIDLNGVCFSYVAPGSSNEPDESAYALRHIDMHIKKGEKVAVVGANGAGKTTLVKLICGLYRPT